MIETILIYLLPEIPKYHFVDFRCLDYNFCQQQTLPFLPSDLFYKVSLSSGSRRLRALTNRFHFRLILYLTLLFLISGFHFPIRILFSW